MVILSSCTNYDDQFDDLNSQITSLKSQLDGFASLSSGLTALQGTVSSLQSAIAAIPTSQTDVSGLEASVASLQASLAAASTSAEVSAISTELAAAQTALADAIAANGTAADTNATDNAALQTSLEAVTATLAELKASLAGASTTTDVATLTASLALVQADLTELLSANNIYTPGTGGLVINDAASLTVAETLGNKLSIINGDVIVTQTSTAMDAAKLQAVVSKIKTVTGSLSYTHSGVDVTAVTFDNVTGVGNIMINGQAPISLPKLTSAGIATLTDHAKVTSISAPLLAKVTELNNGTADELGGTKVTSVDLGSLVRYTDGDLKITLALTGDTTLDLASLTTTSETTGLAEKLDLTVVGGDDLSLPLFVKGDIVARNVKTISAPKFLYTGAEDGNLTPGTSKLETIAVHNVMGNMTLSGYTKLTSVDFIGITDPSKTTPTALTSQVNIITAGDLTTVKIAGKFATVSLTGVTDLTSITTEGQIQDFTLSDTNSLETFTLGHTGLSGFSATSDLNASNKTKLDINTNSALTSFTADKITALGSLEIYDNGSLTAFTLNSSLAVGTNTLAGAATTENILVNITGNDLSSASVQLPSEYNASPSVAGKINQASLEAIATYLAAAEAAISTPAVITSGDVTTGWDYDQGQYLGSVASGGPVATFATASVQVEIDLVSKVLDATGATSLTDQANWDVIEVTRKGSVLVEEVTVQAKDAVYYSKGTADVSYVLNAGGASVTKAVDIATYDADIDELIKDPEFASFGVTMSHETGFNNHVLLTFSGTVSDASVLSMTWTEAGVTHVVTATADAAALSNIDNSLNEAVTSLAAAFNAYQIGTKSATLADAYAYSADGAATMAIYTGTFSKTASTPELKISIKGADYFTGVSVARAAADDDNPVAVTAAFAAQTQDAFIATATTSATAELSSELGLSVTGPAITAVLTPTTQHGTISDGVVVGSGTYMKDYKLVSEAEGAVTANITKRTAWLD